MLKLYQKTMPWVWLMWAALALCLSPFQTSLGDDLLEKDSAFQTLRSAILEELSKEPPIWINDFRRIEAMSNPTAAALADQYEQILKQYQADESIYEYVAILYLFILPVSEQGRARALFEQLSLTGLSAPAHLHNYLEVLDQQKHWFQETLNELLTQSATNWPRQNAEDWLLEKLKAQRQLLAEGLWNLERQSQNDSHASLTAVLCALLMIQQPFSRWAAADRYLLDWQQKQPDEKRKIFLYRSFLRDRFAPDMPLTADKERSFLGLMLFAEAEEQPSLQEESDRLLTKLDQVADDLNQLTKRITNGDKEHQRQLAECNTLGDQAADKAEVCLTLAKTLRTQLDECQRDYDQTHKPARDQCDQHRKTTEQRQKTLSGWQQEKKRREGQMIDCDAWLQRCLSEYDVREYNNQYQNCEWRRPDICQLQPVWQQEHKQWRSQHQVWMAEAKAWEIACEQSERAFVKWGQRCRPIQQQAYALDDCQPQAKALNQQMQRCKSLADQWEIRKSGFIREKQAIHDDRLEVEKEIETLQERYTQQLNLLAEDDKNSLTQSKSSTSEQTIDPDDLAAFDLDEDWDDEDWEEPSTSEDSTESDTHILFAALETLGRGEDPVTQGIEQTTESLVKISYQNFPEATEQILETLSHFDDAINAVVEYIDDSSGGRKVSTAWQTLDEHTQARILGAGKILSMAVPVSKAKFAVEIADKVKTLRQGKNIHVKNIKEARQVLDAMPDLRNLRISP
ncbi:hypothetical protein [Endozoicomonas arenosclerae]|uniref:hypothetical protein n=1 Tax=Endozoicomonas arenosclerae TaxID=1633495 RepID=UPI0007858F66|nr:hypothetical protein [Endozoicomonas arenosclerae]